MIQRLVPSEYRRDAHLKVSPTLPCLVLLVCFSTGLIAQNPSEARSSTAGLPMRVMHVLGLEGIPNNTNGNLSIQAGALQFQKDGGLAAPIGITSIQGIFIGEQDKQVGGISMAVLQAATPYSGGRVIALFSHKKYDTLTIEYRDSDGGLHGAIFQLNKGQGQVLRNKLIAGASHQ